MVIADEVYSIDETSINRKCQGN